MLMAVREAERLNHDAIDTEHILLGLLSQSSGVAATVLETFNVHAFLLVIEIEKQVPPRTGVSISGRTTANGRC